MRHHRFAVLLFCVSFLPTELSASDWPMLGRDRTHNAVSFEANAPISWQVERQQNGKTVRPAQNVKWTADLGPQTYGEIVVSDGLVWIGTVEHRAGKDGGGALVCLREEDGKELFRYVAPRRKEGRVLDWPYSSIANAPLIEGDRLWFTTNRWDVVCLDIGPLLASQDKPNRTPADDPVLVWKINMLDDLGIFARGTVMAICHTCSVASYGDRLYVITGNGVDEADQMPSPDAPSLLCLDKHTGKVLWSDNSPGENILYGQWSSPLVAEIGKYVQVIVPQGDSWIRSFEALSGELLWEFDMNFKEAKWVRGGRRNRNIVLAAPVLYKGRIYIASGQHPIDGESEGRLVCLDPTMSGDISSELAVNGDGNKLPHRRLQAVDPEQGERAIPNPNSGLKWEFTKSKPIPGEDEGLSEMHGSVSNVTIANDILIACDFYGAVHCLNVQSGKRYWSYDALSQLYASPLVVDDKIYVPNEDGDVMVFRLSGDPEIAMHDGEPVAVCYVGSSVYSSPIFANGTLYVGTRKELIAIGDTRDSDVSGVRLKRRMPRPIFVPTPHDIVREMLKLANLTSDDTVVDLGSGDGRIVITAAKEYGCQSIGYEIDHALVEESRLAVRKAGLTKLVKILDNDMFTADLSKTTVATTFLYSGVLEKMIPQFAKMPVGSRIVAHHFEIPGIKPDRVVDIESLETGQAHRILIYTTPLKPTMGE